LLPWTQKGRDLLQTKGPYAGLTIDDEIEINLIVEKLDKLIDTIADKADIFRDSRNALPEPFQNLGQKPPDADRLAVVLDSLTIEDRSDVKEAIIDEELDLAAKFDISIVLDENGEDDDEPEVVLVEKVEPWTPSSMAGNRKKLLAILKRYGGVSLEQDGEILMEKLNRAMLALPTVQTVVTSFFGKAYLG